MSGRAVETGHSRRGRSGRAVIALVALASLLLGPAPPAAADGPLRMMAVGDSITQGSAGDHTWRYWLWRTLTGAGWDATFVGSETAMRDGGHDYAEPGFPTAHEAAWGRALWQEVDRIQAEVAAHHPDVLLVLLGLNDVMYGQWQGGRGPANLQLLVANARAARPDIAVVVSEIWPACFPDLLAQLPAVNEQLRQAVSGLSSAGSPVRVVPVDPDYSTTADTYDCVHPAPPGEQRMAAAFHDGLAGLGIGPGGTGTRVPVAWPRPPAPPSVVAAGDDADLTWPAVPGATSYTVESRSDGSADVGRTVTATPATRLARPVAGQLVVQVATSKGSWTGPPSAPAVVPPRSPAPVEPAPAAVRPGRVTGLVVSVRSGRVRVGWSAPRSGTPTGYVVRARRLPSGGWHRIDRQPGSVTAVRWVPRRSGVHRISVAATAPAGRGPWSGLAVRVPRSGPSVVR